MMQTWKKLLIQAFLRTPIPVNARGRCQLFHVHRFIYLSLQQAGIENRSPFSLWQILDLYIRSRGNPAALRALSIDKLRALDKPALGFGRMGQLIASLTLVSGLTLFVAPKTANTYLLPNTDASILAFVIHPINDVDALETHLPSSTDNPFSPHVTRLRGELAGEHWIRQQPDSSYALQMLSTSSLANLNDFCIRHNICQQSAYYRTTVNDRPLYRLLYGVYRNHKAAKLARTSLPQDIRDLAPWARQFKKVKTEIAHK